MIEAVITARRRDLGGLEVGRVLPAAQRRMVGPFIFFDHIGPVVFPPAIPRTTDVRPHPHIGLATITYLFRGEIVHRDSLGIHQVIRPGEVNWMTAGRGISHSERFETMREHGGALEGIQAWVALPEADEEIEPSFVHVDARELPMLAPTGDGVRVRVIAGSAFGSSSPVRTRSPLFYAHVDLAGGARCEAAARYSERAAYVVAGRVAISKASHGVGDLIVFGAGDVPEIAALEPSTVMLLGGEPLGERHIWWNYVSSRPERIEQAKDDWRSGRIPLPAGDDREFIPLPDDRRPDAAPPL